VKKAVLEMGFEETTPIQAKAIPQILEGKDVIAQAPTGTGKTCAFGIPAIEKVDPDNSQVQMLVLAPTRELVIQIAKEFRNLCKYKDGVRLLPIYGGQPIDRQILALKKRPQIIIGTPGRIMDHLRRRTIKINELKMIILDEADEMLNMGFREDIDTILEEVEEKDQFILFSATLPKPILDIAHKYQNDPVTINVVHKVMTVPTIDQYYLEVRENRKVEVLSRLIDANKFKLSVVFCNTKKRVDDLCKELLARGYSAEALHGDMKQMHRDSVMNKFRTGLVDILIATDVAARGIDVDDVDAVFNYDIPTDEEYYVHRIGRTGRAKRKGESFTFVTGREMGKIKEIQRYTKSKMKLIKPPTIEDIKENKLNSVTDKLAKELSGESLERYTQYIDNMVEEISEKLGKDVTSMDIAAAFLKNTLDNLVMGANDHLSVEELEDKGFTRTGSRDRDRDRGRDNDFSRDSDSVRLFINLGKKDQMQTAQLVKFIASSTDIPGKAIGKIDILDKFSFFEIPGAYVEEAIEVLPTQKVRGRKINVEVANKKKR
jgi:ATP-dependent RNA helicase DeaD